MDPFSFCYSDGNKIHTFNNGGSNGHGLKNVMCKQTLKLWYIFTKSEIRKALKLGHSVVHAYYHYGYSQSLSLHRSRQEFSVLTQDQTASLGLANKRIMC